MIVMMNTLLQGALMLLALVAMVLLLAGMHSLFGRGHGVMDDRSADDLRKQMSSHEERVMSDKNVFHSFLAREGRPDDDR